jgi:hypothetical protein
MKAIKKGTKRPEVFIVQSALKHKEYILDIDGNCGKITAGYIKDEQTNLRVNPIDAKWGDGTWRAFLKENPNFKLDPYKWIHQLIGLFENSMTKDGYGFAENDIGDMAGWNGGILQHNRLGSMETLLILAGRKDLLKVYNNSNKYVINYTIKDWLGSKEGIDTQNKYFEKYIIKKAKKELSMISGLELSVRSLGMYCDSSVQNGTMYSYRKPFFAKKQSGIDKELYTGKNWNAKFPEIPFEKWKNIWKQDFQDYSNLSEKEAILKTNIKIMNHMVSLLNTQERKMELLAQYRARTSSYRYWADVLSRRLIWAEGEGIVHGTHYDIYDDFFYNNVGLL